MVLPTDGRSDPQFLHAVLCQLGLPRNPTPSKTFERRSGRAHLSLQAGRTFNGLKFVDQPLPSGTRPRLVLINLCSEAVRTRDRNVNIGGSVREFLRRLNIDPGGKSMALFRKQMLALSCCRMTLGMMTANGPVQVNAEPIEGFQAWHTDEDGQQTLWPGYICLTEKFFESLTEHAVPLETEAIGRLQNSAFALDAYSWLGHRLCRVNDPQGVLVSWAALKEQFGQEYSTTKDFRRRFLGALKSAIGAYQDARIDIVRGGLRLLPSPPPVRRKMVALPPAEPACEPALPPPSPPASGRLAMYDLVSEKALGQVPEMAPGWDKHHLAATYVEYVNNELGGERPRSRDAAFLGWVRKFTKGKRA